MFFKNRKEEKNEYLDLFLAYAEWPALWGKYKKWRNELEELYKSGKTNGKTVRRIEECGDRLERAEERYDEGVLDSLYVKYRYTDEIPPEPMNIFGEKTLQEEEPVKLGVVEFVPLETEEDEKHEKDEEHKEEKEKKGHAFDLHLQDFGPARNTVPSVADDSGDSDTTVGDSDGEAKEDPLCDSAKGESETGEEALLEQVLFDDELDEELVEYEDELFEMFDDYEFDELDEESYEYKELYDELDDIPRDDSEREDKASLPVEDKTVESVDNKAETPTEGVNVIDAWPKTESVAVIIVKDEFTDENKDETEPVAETITQKDATDEDEAKTESATEATAETQDEAEVTAKNEAKAEDSKAKVEESPIPPEDRLIIKGQIFSKKDIQARYRKLGISKVRFKDVTLEDINYLLRLQ